MAFRWIDAARRDLRHRLRALRRKRGFSIVVVLVLALGTSASTAVFTPLNRIVLQPLPFPASDRLVTVAHAIPAENVSQAGTSSVQSSAWGSRSGGRAVRIAPVVAMKDE